MKRSRLLIELMIVALVAGITLILIGLMPAPATHSSSNRMTAKAGNLNVQLVMTPPPAAFSTTTFDITITDEKGAPVSDAIVSLDLTMPSMYIARESPARASVGRWQISCDRPLYNARRLANRRDHRARGAKTNRVLSVRAVIFLHNFSIS